MPFNPPGHASLIGHNLPLHAIPRSAPLRLDSLRSAPLGSLGCAPLSLSLNLGRCAGLDAICWLVGCGWSNFLLGRGHGSLAQLPRLGHPLPPLRSISTLDARAADRPSGGALEICAPAGMPLHRRAWLAVFVLS